MWCFSKSMYMFLEKHHIYLYERGQSLIGLFAAFQPVLPRRGVHLAKWESDVSTGIFVLFAPDLGICDFQNFFRCVDQVIGMKTFQLRTRAKSPRHAAGGHSTV